MARTYLESIAYEKAANERAKLDLYGNAALKEMEANERAKAAGFTNAAAQEADANRRAKLAGFPGGAVQQENDANARSIAAGFTSAVDQEIDANRRARDAGYLNAADYESGLRTRSYDEFVDPRDVVWTGPSERYHIDTHNLLKYNPDQPTHPDYDPDWASKYDAATDTYILDKPTGGGGTTTGAAGSMDLAAFRPWTQQYWNQFMPKTEGLLYMQKPQRDYGLAYLPGEMRDPAGWGLWEEGEKGHSGHVPGGGWRFTPESYKAQTGSRAGQRAPWHFTSGEAQATNIYDNPWSAAQMNLTPAQGAKWKGLLTGLDTAPAIDTSVASLLGVK